MTPRVLVPDLGSGVLVRLPADEGRHLTRVLRLGAGDAVRVFDGRGRELAARIETVERGAVTVRTLGPVDAAPEPRVEITLAPAFLKGDAIDAVVRDATMLGVRRIEPVVAERSLVSLAAARRGRRDERWGRIAAASAKQCGRAVLPGVSPPEALSTWLRTATADLRLLLVEPRADVPGVVTLDALEGRPVPGTAALLVGPEGGWTPGEIEDARAQGWLPLRLGFRTLRAETVPVVALAVLLAVWREL